MKVFLSGSICPLTLSMISSPCHHPTYFPYLILTLFNFVFPFVLSTGEIHMKLLF